MNICIFGDSTAWGAWDTERHGWVNRLQLFLDSQGKVDTPIIYNLSVSGGTTDTILKRFEAEAKIRKADALIFQGGGNDSCLRGKDGPNQIPIEVFRRNVEEIITKSKHITSKIVFIGFKNVDEENSAPVAWRDIYYLNSEIQKYDTVIEEVCRKSDVLYINIFGLLDKDDIEDGVHPNVKGHVKLFETVRDYLIDQAWI
jgi:lysophospholipase L1-like esterase